MSKLSLTAIINKYSMLAGTPSEYESLIIELKALRDRLAYLVAQQQLKDSKKI